MTDTADNVESKPKRKRMPAYESLNARERRLVDATVAGAPPAEAGRVAGYSTGTTTEYWQRAKRKPAFREAVRECMEAIGLDPEGIASRLVSGADSSMQYVTTKDGQIHERPDPHARAKYLDMALKVQGAYPAPWDQGGANVQVVVISPENSLAAANPFSAPVVESPSVRELKPGES